MFKEPLIVSYRKGRPLKDILVRAKLERKLDLLQSRVGLSAPIYARLLNGRFELSEETFCKMLLDYRGECDFKTNEIEENQEVILSRGKKRF